VSTLINIIRNFVRCDNHGAQDVPAGRDACQYRPMIDGPADFLLNSTVFHVHRDDDLFTFLSSHADMPISSRLKTKSQNCPCTSVCNPFRVRTRNWRGTLSLGSSCDWGCLSQSSVLCLNANELTHLRDKTFGMFYSLNSGFATELGALCFVNWTWSSDR
jgi:hypothetical protein